MSKENKRCAAAAGIAIALFILTLTLPDGTAAYAGTLISLYLFTGAVVAWCRINEKVEAHTGHILELIFFWLL